MESPTISWDVWEHLHKSLTRSLNRSPVTLTSEKKTSRKSTSHPDPFLVFMFVSIQLWGICDVQCRNPPQTLQARSLDSGHCHMQVVRLPFLGSRGCRKSVLCLHVMHAKSTCSSAVQEDSMLRAHLSWNQWCLLHLMSTHASWQTLTIFSMSQMC